jgi:hypothetical protein
MSSEKSPFCSDKCFFKKEEDLDFICNDCVQSKDQVYEKPIPIEMIWYANVWIQALILGENGADYIIKSPKMEGVTYVKKTSKLLRT